MITFFTAWTYPKTHQTWNINHTWLKMFNLLSSWISTTRWCYNQGKYVLAYNSHIFYSTFKNLISMHSLNCDEHHDIGQAHFCICFFFFFSCKFVLFKLKDFIPQHRLLGLRRNLVDLLTNLVDLLTMSPDDSWWKVLPGDSIVSPGILTNQAPPPKCTYMNKIRYAYVSSPDAQITSTVWNCHSNRKSAILIPSNLVAVVVWPI